MKKRIFALAVLAALAVGAGNSAQADALVVSVIVGTFTDGGPAWQTALNNAGVPADLYYDPQNPANGWPDLTPYDAVVVVYNDVWWTTAQGAFGPADEAVMAGYGGVLVIIGQDYIWSTGGGAGPSAWLMSRFNITSVIEDVNYGDVDLMTLTGSVGGPFDGLIDSGMPCWVDNGWFTDDVTHSGIPTQDWVSPLGSGHGGCFVADGLFSTNAYECFDNFQLWVDRIVDFFGLVGGECPADVNGDGTVDVLDLLAVLAAWGATGGPEDINGDGIVNVLDLLELLAAWGPCAAVESGACCFPDTGDCLDLFESTCVNTGGNWQGPGTECATTNCPQPPLGACCDPFTGDCQDLIEYDCVQGGGDWQGAGTECATTNCPSPQPGACCLWPSGDCFDTLQGDCVAFGGNWQGPGTSCATVTCPTPALGACCTALTGGCQDLTAADCILANGMWMGEGTECATTSCPTGGDTIADPIPIQIVPLSLSASTVPYAHDYDEVCPYTGSLAPDVVFSYTPAANEVITITLCADSLYDTKLFVYENAHTPGAPFACSDDACTTPAGQTYVSELPNLSLTGGNTYYIVIDGYSSGAGVFTMDIY